MTFDSVYEILTPLSTVRKTKSWHWFDGNALRSWWNETVFGGGGTVSMADAVGEGLKIVTNAISSDGKQIDFNDIRHYLETASVLIGTFRSILTTTQQNMVGFRGPKVGNDFAIGGVHTDKDAVNYIMRTADATTASFESTTVALDTVFHVHKIEMGSSNIKHSMDGVLEITKTTNRPVSKQQPVFFAQTRTSSAREAHIRYLEVLNK